ncbi:hypothetical protein JHW43_008836, partial [Diplocarpon mali]
RNRQTHESNDAAWLVRIRFRTGSRYDGSDTNPQMDARIRDVPGTFLQSLGSRGRRANRQASGLVGPARRLPLMTLGTWGRIGLEPLRAKRRLEAPRARLGVTMPMARPSPDEGRLSPCRPARNPPPAADDAVVVRVWPATKGRTKCEYSAEIAPPPPARGESRQRSTRAQLKERGHPRMHAIPGISLDAGHSTEPRRKGHHVRGLEGTLPASGQARPWGQAIKKSWGRRDSSPRRRGRQALAVAGEGIDWTLVRWRSTFDGRRSLHARSRCNGVFGVKKLVQDMSSCLPRPRR